MRPPKPEWSDASLEDFLDTALIASAVGTISVRGTTLFTLWILDQCSKMIMRRDDTRDWSLIRNIEEERHALAPPSCDELVGFRDSHLAKELVSFPFSPGLRDDSTNDELSDSKTSAVDVVFATADEVLVALVYQALNSSGYPQLRNLQAYCHSGRVTLQGRLPTYFLKQVAQTVIRSVIGVRDIDNDVKVVSSW